MKNEILLSHNFIAVKTVSNADKASTAVLGTLVSNFMSYGYVLSEKALNSLANYSKEELKVFWKNIKPALDEVTGKNRNMENFVVYKNFPEEVLEKSQAEYWIAQVLMYCGAPNEYFTQEEKARDPLLEDVSVKVLHVAPENVLETIWEGYVASKTRWSDNQSKYALWLIEKQYAKIVDVASFGFKENAIVSVKNAIEQEIPVKIHDATDVLRFAAALSDADVSLRAKVKFKNFTRHERKVLLSVLEETKNLEEDMAMRKNLWKKFLSRLHPGDFKFERVKAAYNSLYKGELKSFNSQVETLLNGTGSRVIETEVKFADVKKHERFSLNDLKNKVTVTKTVKTERFDDGADKKALDIVSTRPGEMIRRFHKLYEVFGVAAIESFVKVMSKLSVHQLLKFSKYVETIDTRKQLIFAPKGNWTKAQIVENKKVKMSVEDKTKLLSALSNELSARLNAIFPEGIMLDEKTKQIKLQTNDQELAEYGRGTVFDIPENINFIRSASYWAAPTLYNNIWYDNGWNFFKEDWTVAGTCCWNSTDFGNKAAIFSGDPTNSKDMEGRACQMIDLYLDKLAQQGVRYAVWNILAYSRQSFNSAKEVLATLQMGEEAVEGQLYEPSRAQMVFPLKGDNLTKYIAYVDVKERKLVYIDANLYGQVQSASYNESTLMVNLPAYMEYMETLPSVYDLMSYVKAGTTPVLFSDKDSEIKSGKAYVFKKENDKNEFENIDLNALLK